MAVKKKLGQILIDKGVIDEMQLKAALGHQKKWGCRLGTALLELGFVSEDSLAKTLSFQSHVPGMELLNKRIPEEVFKLIPKDVASKYGVVPVAVKDTPGRKTLVVAMSDPTNLTAVDELDFLTRCKIEPMVAPDSSIKKRLQQYGEEFIHTYHAVETPRVSAEPAKPAEVTLTEEVPSEETPPEEESVVVVDEEPDEAPAAAQEEPMPLTEVSTEASSEVSVVEQKKPAPAVAHVPQGAHHPPEGGYTDMVVVSESRPPKEEAPQSTPDLSPSLSALEEELSRIKISINDIQVMLLQKRAPQQGPDLSPRLDDLEANMAGVKKSLESTQEVPQRMHHIEESVQELKNLLQTLLNFLLDKGIFTKEELLTRLKS